MTQEFYTLFTALAMGMVAAFVIYPLLIRLSKKLNFTDRPNHRKVHRQPVPLVGGIGIILAVAITAVFSSPVREALAANIAVTVSLLLLGITGVLDDRIDLSAKFRLLLQLACSFAVAYSGIRINSLHGFMGIYVLPQEMQYALTITIITGITNAFNLIDGIDGLAGSLAFINVSVLACLALFADDLSLASLLLAVAGALAAFLKFNWRPASIFMGDGGSLVLGFLMSVAAICMLEIPYMDNEVKSALPVVLATMFAIPVIDALRVFSGRMRRGRSPFSADKTHLHHKLIQHFMLHNAATKKIITLHLLILSSSFVLHRWISISAIMMLVLVLISLYSLFLDFTQNFSVWYRKMRHYEDSL